MDASIAMEVQHDRAVIDRVLAGEREAFAIIVRRYREKFGRYATSICGDSDSAADAMQEAFIKAYESLHGCRNRDRFGSWFFRILTNSCHDVVRRRGRRHLSLEAGHAVSDRSPEGDIIRQEEVARMNRAVTRLPGPQREAFSLKHVTGLSYEEMSDLLHEPIATLKMRVYRARNNLREALRD